MLLVVSQPDRKRGRGAALTSSPVKAAAQALGLHVTDRPDDVLDAVADGAELGVVVAYGRLIKGNLLDVLPFVNLHFSLLPRWRGAAPVERAVLAGDAETGVCLMALEAGLDTGPVYQQVRTPIGEHESAATLRERLVTIGTAMLVAALGGGPLDPGTAVPQRGDPTYAAKLDPSEFVIDWQDTADAIARLTRLGAAWTVFRGKRLKVLEAVVDSASVSTSDAPCADFVQQSHSNTDVPGTILGVRPMVHVVTGEGVLRVVRVQPEGKASMDAAAWRNGVQPCVGDRLGT